MEWVWGVMRWPTLSRYTKKCARCICVSVCTRKCGSSTVFLPLEYDARTTTNLPASKATCSWACWFEWLFGSSSGCSRAESSYLKKDAFSGPKRDVPVSVLIWRRAGQQVCLLLHSWKKAVCTNTSSMGSKATCLWACWNEGVQCGALPVLVSISNQYWLLIRSETQIVTNIGYYFGLLLTNLNDASKKLPRPN